MELRGAIPVSVGRGTILKPVALLLSVGVGTGAYVKCVDPPVMPGYADKVDVLGDESDEVVLGYGTMVV